MKAGGGEMRVLWDSVIPDREAPAVEQRTTIGTLVGDVGALHLMVVWIRIHWAGRVSGWASPSFPGVGGPSPLDSLLP